MLFTRWRALHTWKNQKNMESHSHRNVHEENPYTKNMESHLHRMCMTKTHIQRNGRHLHFCTNDNHFFLNGFSSCTFLYKWLPFRCIWFFVMHILCKWLSIFFVYGFLSCTFLCERLSIFFWFFHACNALQRVNSMVQWQNINDIIMHIGFDHVLNALQRLNS